MSNFQAIVKNPRGGEEVTATYIEDHFGKGNYGVQIEGENTVYEESDVVYVRGMLDEPVADNDWLDEQIAFYDFIWEVGTQLCGHHVNEELMKDFAKGGRLFIDLKAKIRKVFPTLGEAYEAFKDPQKFYEKFVPVESTFSDSAAVLTEQSMRDAIATLDKANEEGKAEGMSVQVGSYTKFKEYLISKNVIGAVEHARDPVLISSYWGMGVTENVALSNDEIILVDGTGKVLGKWILKI